MCTCTFRFADFVEMTGGTGSNLLSVEGSSSYFQKNIVEKCKSIILKNYSLIEYYDAL